MRRKSYAVGAVLFAVAFSAQAQDRRISGDSWFGCTSKEYHGKLIGYAVQKDMEAFKQGLTAGVLTGACVMFKAGEPVFIADTAIFSGLVKVRRKGSTSEYWTNLEAVSK
jgi:hypothetical protein